LNNKNNNQTHKFLENIMKKNKKEINIITIYKKHNIVNNKMKYLIMKNKI
jgi:hypothetical protein